MTFCLDYLDANDQPRTFSTPDALWAGERWNGFPALQLPKWQAHLLTQLIGEEAGMHPRADMDEDRTEECAYVWMDGLTWYEAVTCPDCGMPHTAEHSCEPISWTYGS